MLSRIWTIYRQEAPREAGHAGAGDKALEAGMTG